MTLAVLLGCAALLASSGQETEPAYVRRGDEVEARYGELDERLKLFHDSLSSALRANAPDLLPEIEGRAPDRLRPGYQILPAVVPDSKPTDASSLPPSVYSWPWTETMIDRELPKLAGALSRLNGPSSRRELGELVADYKSLRDRARLIDEHIQHNWLWQREITNRRAAFDRATELYELVAERRRILEALRELEALGSRHRLDAIPGLDWSVSAAELARRMREHEHELLSRIRSRERSRGARDYLSVRRAADGAWSVAVPIYTDISDPVFRDAFEKAVEDYWQWRDDDSEFRVDVDLRYIASDDLYRGRDCSTEGDNGCRPPARGDSVVLAEHVALFPGDGGGLTTGADKLHVTGNVIVLGPQDIRPRTMAHEAGHLLGFPDQYVRGYRDLGEDGFAIMEVVPDVSDIMATLRVRSRAAPPLRAARRRRQLS